MKYTVLNEKDLYCLTEVTRDGVVTLSNMAMSNKLTTLSYWGVTIFVKVGDEENELEFIYNRPAEYPAINSICSVVLVEYLRKHQPNVDLTDISGRDWTASIMTRILRKPDIDLMLSEGCSFYKNTYLPGELKNHYEVNFFDKPYEEAKLVNNKPGWLK